jgi:pimeloyl-ACP methyl ester carboxylesterase
MAAADTTKLSERTVTLPRDLTVRVIDDGQGPVVLMLHGSPDNADEYRHLIRRLKADHRCIAPDLPGYGPLGRSYALPRSYDYGLEAQTVFVDELLAALGINEKVTLVVHDIGGIMGVPWAARNNARLRSVVYTNTVAFPSFRWFTLARVFGASGIITSRIAAANMGLIGLFNGALFRRQFGGQNPQLDADELDRFTADFACNRVAKGSTLREFRQITRPGFFAGYDEMVKAIASAVPTLTIWGEGDPYLPKHWAEQLFARTTVFLPDVGHWVPIIAAERLAAEIRALR